MEPGDLTGRDTTAAARVQLGEPREDAPDVLIPTVLCASGEQWPVAAAPVFSRGRQCLVHGVRRPCEVLRPSR